MANKFGNKLAKTDPDTPAILKAVQGRSLAGAPAEANRVGPLPASTPRPPVSGRGRVQRGRAYS